MATELKRLCHQIVDRDGLLHARLPARSAVAEAADRISAADNVLVPETNLDLDITAREIVETIASGLHISQKQIRDAPWCLWDTTPALASDGATLAVLHEAWESYDRPRVFRSLAASFMKSYGPEQLAREHVAELLRDLAARWGGTWGELHERHEIFDLERGPVALAREAIQSDRPPLEILREAGIGDIAASGGLARQVVEALLGELVNNLDHEKRLTQIDRFALRQDGHLKYPDQGPAVMEALVKPFLSQNPGADLQDKFLAVIVRAFGDPRLRPGSWHNLPHKDLILSWLTRQSLRQFLDVVDETTVDRSAKRMWKFRRAFWEGVYEFYRQHGIAVEAWVAFGPNGQNAARRTFGSAEFATLHTDGKQVSSDHAVLLFKVGDCVVADWNHNGKCHIWNPSSTRPAPKLYGPHYGSNEVQIFAGQGNHETRHELSWGHGGSEHYTWQGKVADRLDTVVGLRIPERAYRLR